MTTKGAGRSSGVAGRGRLYGAVLGDRYRIQSLIARGGMGEIYTAVQEPLRRRVAVKVLSPSYTDSEDLEEFRMRFEREAAACARLSHANTVRIFDFGRHEDVFYIVMEYVKGDTLSRVVRRDGPMEPLKALHIAAQVCGALIEAHDEGIIHRDLKPSNLIITTQNDDDSFVKLLDFGLVKDAASSTSTQLSTIKGSPVCISPEQIRRQPVDARCDVYALGVVLYFMVVGKFPFEGDEPMAIMLAHLTQEPSFLPASDGTGDEAPRELPKSVEWLISTCLEKASADRFVNAREMLKAIEVCAVGLERGDEDVEMTLTSGLFISPAGYSESQTGTPRLYDGGLRNAIFQQQGAGRILSFIVVCVLLGAGMVLIMGMLGTMTPDAMAPAKASNDVREQVEAAERLEQANEDAKKALAEVKEQKELLLKLQAEEEKKMLAEEEKRSLGAPPEVSSQRQPPPSRKKEVNAEPPSKPKDEKSWKLDSEIRDPFAD